MKKRLVSVYFRMVEVEWQAWSCFKAIAYAGELSSGSVGSFEVTFGGPMRKGQQKNAEL